MKNYEPGMSFGEDAAKKYEDYKRGDEDEAVAFLEQAARGGPALELAIGAGRIGLPLAATGIRVDGIDFSPDMVAQLRAQPGGADLNVTIGDYADVAVPGKYRLIYIVFNTLHNLLTQDEQVRCFENVADHLTDDGVFVIEGSVPSRFYRLQNDQYVEAEAIGVDEVRLDVAQHDPVKQLLYENHVSLTSEGVRLNPIVTRHIWPSELDLMARIAGLRLKERWDGWERQPYTSTTEKLVSVYAR
ncbi:MAG: class I SAM-dependent methyltransferase [SAR202 cluster bacterium]|jgi:SAM-dependent methyltransferase|nr:class I SAM-dependent methyltransferase [SAR202 cluster bacterium]